MGEDGEENEAGRRPWRIVLGTMLFAIGAVLHYLVGADIVYQLVVFVTAYLVLGYDVLAEAIRGIVHVKMFGESVLMSVATVGAFFVGAYPEAVAVMLLYQIGEMMEDRAVDKSKRSISDLMDIQPDSANLLVDGRISVVDPKEVPIGSVIIIKPGEKVPLDGTVVSGSSSLNTAALTGESIPRDVAPGDAVVSGCINLTGAIDVKVAKSYGDSTASKVLELIKGAEQKKARSERFIDRFSQVYTPIVVAAAAVVAILPPLLWNGNWSDWIYRALVFLVVSCPCAFVLSIPLTFFSGIGCASRNGILVKGGNYIESLARTDTVVMDKTGTLTKGTFAVGAVRPADGFTADELLKAAAEAESMSDHPIAQSIRRAYGGPIDTSVISVEEIPGKGVGATVGGTALCVGNERLMADMGIAIEEPSEIGTVVYVSIDGVFAGSITVRDVEKEDARCAVAHLKIDGVRRTVMLTGDRADVAHGFAGSFGIDEVYSDMLPADKVSKVEELMAQVPKGRKLVYVGDGINDAPVLKRADVGVAMGGLGSDAAIAASDVVIMTDEPSKVSTAIGIAKRTMRIVGENTAFAIVVKFSVLVLAAMGMVGMWVGVLADVGVTIIAVLNSTRALSVPGQITKVAAAPVRSD